MTLYTDAQLDSRMTCMKDLYHFLFIFLLLDVDGSFSFWGNVEVDVE